MNKQSDRVRLLLACMPILVFSCRGASEATNLSPRGQSERGADHLQQPPAKAQTAVKFTFEHGSTIKFDLSTASTSRWDGNTLVVTSDTVDIRFSEHDWTPISVREYKERYSAQILEIEGDEEHVAVALDLTESPWGDDGFQAKAWVRGVRCLSEAPSSDAARRAFRICKSMRRSLPIYEYERVPQIRTTMALGVPLVEVSTGQFTLGRVEAGKFTCEEWQGFIDEEVAASHERVHSIRGQTFVSRWTAEPESASGQSKIFATVGDYCCFAEVAEWFVAAGDDELEFLGRLCVDADQPGWPEDFLPKPIGTAR